MKLYVDELPKSCEKCEFRDTKYGRCDISGARVDYFGCHALTPLSYYTKQVRKEVCEIITDEVLDISHKYWKTFLKNGVQYMTSEDLYELLKEISNRIQGENN